MRQSLALVAIALLFPLLNMQANAQAEATWTKFRGPEGQGHSDAVDLPLEWSEDSNVAWKTPITGKGWSSPVVADGKVWLTSATKVAASAAETEAKTADSLLAAQMAVAKTITLWVHEIDLHSGKVLRQIKLADVKSPQPIHSLNSYASPTPILAAGRLYCHFGDYGTFCLDTKSGKIVWKQHIPLDHGVGPGSTPLLYDDLLILTCDGRDKQYIVALNIADGNEAWRTDRPPIRTDEPEMRKAFCTPLLIEVQGKEQMVIPGAQWFVAYAPRTGKEIWRIDHGGGFSNVPSPVFDGEHVYLCTGYGTSQLWAVRPDGRGDLTDSDHVSWKAKKQIPNMPSPVLVDQRLYIIGDGGIAQCFEAATGKPLWKKRIGGKFSASPLYADGRIYICNHDGRTTVFAPGDEYRELAQNDLDGQLMASPIVADGDLLLRTESHLYRIGK